LSWLLHPGGFRRFCCCCCRRAAAGDDAWRQTSGAGAGRPPVPGPTAAEPAAATATAATAAPARPQRERTFGLTLVWFTGKSRPLRGAPSRACQRSCGGWVCNDCLCGRTPSVSSCDVVRRCRGGTGGAWFCPDFGERGHDSVRARDRSSPSSTHGCRTFSEALPKYRCGRMVVHQHYLHERFRMPHILVVCCIAVTGFGGYKLKLAFIWRNVPRNVPGNEPFRWGFDRAPSRLVSG